MKKLVTKILMLLMAVVVFGFMAKSVSASIYDNWKGILQGRARTIEGHWYGDAEGEVVLNYRKGQKNYIVNLNAIGLKPETTYDVVFYIGDSPAIQQKVGSFTADIEGYGHLNIRDFTSSMTNFDSYETPPRFLVKLGDWRVLTTYGAAIEGAGEDLNPVGSNRGE
jgi:hypothetical protein